MNLCNKIMLITYADSMGKNLKELEEVMKQHFEDAVGGIHILPFFPSSADRGFAPMRYDCVDPQFGTFQEIEDLGKQYYLMFDFMINHISVKSPYFQDYIENKGASNYAKMFIQYRNFWKNGEPTQEEVDAIYKRKPRAPYVDVKFSDGTEEKVWCTFCEEQIDLDVSSTVTKQFVKDTLQEMCKHGVAIIRLDAFAYAVKKAGHSCFFEEPEIWNLLKETEDIVRPYGVSVLPEIHEHYRIQMKLAKNGYFIYDFALPVLLLHALYFADPQYLLNWLLMSPMKQFTTLDTHDGIGIVDVKDLLPEEMVEATKEKMYEKGANVKKIYSSAAYHNLDVYQVNTTYYSALGNDDDAYLLARAVQFFAPGIPQVYYVGMLAGENDLSLMENTKNGRDINRHYFSKEEINQQVKKPVVKELLALMKFRNTHPAFHLDGKIEIMHPEPSSCYIRRSYGKELAELYADFKTHQYTIQYSQDGRMLSFNSNFNSGK